MTPDNHSNDPAQMPARIEEEAARIFLRRQSGDWTVLDQADFEVWVADPARAKEYQKVTNAWRALGNQAALPELIALRGEVLGRARKTKANDGLKRGLYFQRRWAATAVLVLVSGLVASLYINRTAEVAYETGLGEQRIVELDDGSKITIDAQTTIRARLTRDSRVIELAQGQAQFTVASDPRRPFRVEAGEHTITAVGTSFSVEYQDQHMQVAMVEGKVAVSVGRDPGSGGSSPIDLVAGQELVVGPDGRAQLIPKADIAVATAWRQRMLILKYTPLSDAVRELNRHSRLQIAIGDPSLGALRISGVFELGDTQAFIEAVESFLPVVASQDGSDRVLLTPGRETK